MKILLDHELNVPQTVTLKLELRQTKYLKNQQRAILLTSHCNICKKKKIA